MANNSSGDNIITLTPDESGLIDLGLAEFQPSSTQTLTPEFDLSFLVTDDGSNTVRDGSCSSNAGDHAEEEADHAAADGRQERRTQDSDQGQLGPGQAAAAEDRGHRLRAQLRGQAAAQEVLPGGG